MTVGLTLMLLVFAGVAFAGAGAALAIMRQRAAEQGERDIGLASVVLMLVTFGALCAILSVGFGAVFGFGGVVMWVAYILASQRIGRFRLEAGASQEWPEEEHHVEDRGY